MAKWISETILLATILTGVSSASDHRPIWTPEGGLIFMSNRDGGDWELYRIGADGKGLLRLTRSAGWDGYADVSPDGKWLIFDRRDEQGGARMIRLDLVSLNERTLITFPENGGGGRVSPDGRHIVYWVESDGVRDLYVMQSDGTEQTRITHTSDSEHDPVFSPTGDQLMTVVNLEQGTAVDVMRVDGRNRERILTVPGRLYGLSWSPDGNQVAFNASDGERQRLYLMHADGTQRRPITDGETNDHQPVWSPDGRRLVFTRESGEEERVMVLDVGTGDVQRFETGG